MNTWAAHRVRRGEHASASATASQGGHAADRRGPRRQGPREEVDIICAGINHQTWYIHILYKGRDLDGAELLEAFERHPVYRKTEKVRIDVLRRFGYYSHRVQRPPVGVRAVVPQAPRRDPQVDRPRPSWINGETGGYLRVCTEGRNWFETDFPKWLQGRGQAHRARQTAAREHGSYIIEAPGDRPRLPRPLQRPQPRLHHQPARRLHRRGARLRGPQRHQHPARRRPAAGLRRHAAPPASTCSGWPSRRPSRGDVTLLKQAMLHDPLTAAVCDPEEIWQMADEMLVAQAKWLPQYRSEIPKARQRLAREKPLGTRSWRGGSAPQVVGHRGLRRGANQPRCRRFLTELDWNRIDAIQTADQIVDGFLVRFNVALQADPLVICPAVSGSFFVQSMVR